MQYNQSIFLLTFIKITNFLEILVNKVWYIVLILFFLDGVSLFGVHIFQLVNLFGSKLL